MTLHWFAHPCHEAGHAIAAWYSGRVTRVEAAQVGERAGFVQYGILHTCAATPVTLWARLVVMLAGIAADFRYGYTVRARDCVDDLDSARLFARELARQCDVLHALPVAVDERRTITRMYVEEPSQAERHAIEAAYLKARALLACYRYEHLAVTLALVVFRKLDTTDLAHLLGPRQVGKVFAMRRARVSWTTMLGRFVRLCWRRCGTNKARARRVASDMLRR